ncbi:hypothetical protein GIB67_019912 [Kingdonia uniflora]|uniref:Uncharacterized protein n=1 Tax=Kingdonia uniflora TaxID=39325 RepID=A0A7J7MKH4_9MAGN|nr:hypothetical protein GIB67_019912 [Kingdonia uniflora]
MMNNIRRVVGNALVQQLKFKHSLLHTDTKVTSVSKYVQDSNFKQALPHSLKAFELQKTELSTQALLENIVQLTTLGRHEEALEKNALLQTISRNLDFSFQLYCARVQAAGLLINCGKLDEALKDLMGIVGETLEDSSDKAFLYLQIANVLYRQGKGVDAKAWLTLASNVLEMIKFEDEGLDLNKMATAAVYCHISILYEEMSELVLAADMLNRALAIHNRWIVPSTQITELLLQFEGNEPLAKSYLTRAVMLLKEVIDSGTKYFEIDLEDISKLLGTAYLKTGLMEMSAVEILLKAKDIAFASCGPNDRVSIWICWNLAEAYFKTQRISLAIDLMREVVEALERHEPSVEELCKSARNSLQMLEDMDQS